MIVYFIPGLTLYRFTSARLHAATMGTAVVVEPKERTVKRFDIAQVQHFIDFITSSLVSTDLPFGKKTLKLSDGTELYVPNSIRNQIPSRIIQQYFCFCNETAMNFPPLETTSLYKMLDICKASTRRSFAGIDYYNADAGEAFDNIIKMVESLGPMSSEHRRLIENLKQSKRYLKSDFKVHVCSSSTVADHCSTYALSDAKDKCFHSMCDHDHKDQCEDCILLKNTFLEIETVLNDTISDKGETERTISKFKLMKESIALWKSHQLRTVHQD
ncbi:unnamed protein product [Rotaria sp. Silwood2]|nr:unnamed protein product [Rotaria sp. Silwood2]